jgi:pantetheine-phosphate adenylyltransferase
MSTAIYPGSFDPPTNGHFDVVERGARLFDRLVVAVAQNPAKHPFLPADERVGMLKKLLRRMPNVTVDSFDGLVVDYARRVRARAILRGIRTFSDFEYEFQMALTNRTLAPETETVFIMTSEKFAFISSRLVREIAGFGGDISAFVPAEVAAAVRRAARRT